MFCEVQHAVPAHGHLLMQHRETPRMVGEKHWYHGHLPLNNL